MGSGFSKLKKQAKQMSAQYEKMQEELERQEFTGTAGSSLVTITLSGNYHIKKIIIKPDCVDPHDIEGLQDLIKAAHQDACQKIQEVSGQMNGLSFPL